MAFFKTASIGRAKLVNKWAIKDSNLAWEIEAAKSIPSVNDSINIFAVFSVDNKWTASSVALCNFAEALAFSEGLDRCFLEKNVNYKRSTQKKYIILGYFGYRIYKILQTIFTN